MAESIHDLFSAFGMSVFLDKRSIPLGKSWEATLMSAVQSARTLLVLWSRNAANSTYMQREWRLVSKECRVIPVLLDGSPLPDDLGQFQALTGFGVAGRILARALELTQEQKLSRDDAHQKILEELAEDGVDLAPDQKKAINGVLAAVSAGGILAALAGTRWWSRQLGRSLLSGKGALLSLGAGLSFGGGYLLQASDGVSEEGACPGHLAECLAKVEAHSAELDKCRTRVGELERNESAYVPSAVASNEPVCWVTVPSVMDKTLAETTKILDAANLSFEPENAAQKPTGLLVVGQNPRAGNRVQSGTPVVVDVAPAVRVPPVLGKSLDEAKALLAKVGLTAGAITTRDQMDGAVLEQKPVAATLVRRGAKVGLVLARGLPAAQAFQSVPVYAAEKFYAQKAMQASAAVKAEKQPEAVKQPEALKQSEAVQPQSPK